MLLLPQYYYYIILCFSGRHLLLFNRRMRLNVHLLPTLYPFEKFVAFFLKNSPFPFQGADWEPPEQDPWAILSRRASLLLRATFAPRASLSARAAFTPQATFLTGATFAPRALSARAAFELLLDSCSFLHRSRLCTRSHVLHGSHLCSKSLLP